MTIHPLATIDENDKALEPVQDEHEGKQNFDVVLVDIRKTASRQVFCVKRNLFDNNLKYVAISYKRANLPEKIVTINRETADEDTYNAHITSFEMEHFYFLCQYIMEEDDLRFIDYLFIDCICIDQANMGKREATIRYISTIYERATYILAVPDLHIASLKLNPVNLDLTFLVEKQYEYLYHLVMNNGDACADIERIWCYNYLCPKDLHPQHFLVFFRKQVENAMKDRQFICSTVIDSVLSKNFSQPSLSNVSTNLSTTIKSHVEKYGRREQTISKCLLPEIQRLEKQYNDRQGQSPHQREDNRWHRHPWRNKLEGKILDWETDCVRTMEEHYQCMKFLIYLLEDWSNNVWVASEIFIARNKNMQQNRMKLFFLALGTIPDDGGRRNFMPVFDDSIMNRVPAYQDPEGLAEWFKATLRHCLRQRHYLDMILGSNVSSNEDRLHAILPLWPKYKHHIQSDDTTISSWFLNDIVTLRLKLYELMGDINDKFVLLKLSAQKDMYDGVPPLPSFAAVYSQELLKALERDILPCYNVESSSITHIDFLPQQADRERMQRYHRLRIRTKEYYKITEDEIARVEYDPETENSVVLENFKHKTRIVLDAFYRKQRAPYNNLQLERKDLAIVVIPLVPFASLNQYPCSPDHIYNSSIILVGNEIMNRWITVQSLNEKRGTCHAYHSPTQPTLWIDAQITKEVFRFNSPFGPYSPKGRGAYFYVY